MLQVKDIKKRRTSNYATYLQQGKMKYLSLGISLDPKYWDFKKDAPKFNCPNIDYLKKIILDKQMEYQK